MGACVNTVRVSRPFCSFTGKQTTNMITATRYYTSVENKRSLTSGVIDEYTSNFESCPKSMVFDNVLASTSMVCCTGPDGNPRSPFSIKKRISRSVVHCNIQSALKLSLVTKSAFGLTIEREKENRTNCYGVEEYSEQHNSRGHDQRQKTTFCRATPYSIATPMPVHGASKRSGKQNDLWLLH